MTSALPAFHECPELNKAQLVKQAFEHLDDISSRSCAAEAGVAAGKADLSQEQLDLEALDLHLPQLVAQLCSTDGHDHLEACPASKLAQHCHQQHHHHQSFEVLELAQLVHLLVAFGHALQLGDL